MSQSDDQMFFTEEAAVLAERWITSKEQIPAAEVSALGRTTEFELTLRQVERFASAYLLRANAADMDERTRRTRERMTAAKAAAGRY
jgi:nuclear pore complex protein Nup155